MKHIIPLTAMVSLFLMFAIAPSFASAFTGQNSLDSTLTITASATKDIIISGKLSAGTNGIDNAKITLQRSTDNVTFSNETTTTTDTRGGYQFSKNESAAGTYYYRSAYDGNATLGNATSNVVTVTVNEILPTPTPTSTPTSTPTPTPTPTSTPTSTPTPTDPAIPSPTPSDNAQKGNKLVCTGLEICATQLAQQASISTVSQKTLLCSPSLLTPIVPSSVLAQVTAMSAEASALSQGSLATSCVVPMTACQDSSIPNIALPAQTNGIASLPLQSVFEFSLVGLGAPTLLIGVLYLLLRKV